MKQVLPQQLLDTLRPVTLVVGHYGVGKTNFAVNLAIDLVARGKSVKLVDLDIVNPYFRASEQRRVLEEHGVELIAPVFAEAGTSLDVPSLTGGISPAIDSATDHAPVIIDVGGDDAGSIALGRFSRLIAKQEYAMLVVVNRFRNLVQDPDDAIENLREIEAACGLRATAFVDNSHLKSVTDTHTIELGYDYATKLAEKTGLAIAAVTAPEHLVDCNGTYIESFVKSDLLYPVKMYVRTPWE